MASVDETLNPVTSAAVSEAHILSIDEGDSEPKRIKLENGKATPEPRSETKEAKIEPKETKIELKPEHKAPEPPVHEVVGGSSVRQYLNKHLTQHLLEGLVQVNKIKPEDPLRELGEFLIKRSEELKSDN